MVAGSITEEIAVAVPAERMWKVGLRRDQVRAPAQGLRRLHRRRRGRRRRLTRERHHHQTEPMYVGHLRLSLI